MNRRAVFLDRDGTINPDPGYISRPDDFALYEEAGPALARLQRAGFALVVVTNQSGVGRGLISPEALTLIHERMERLLSTYGVQLDGVFVCPHHPGAKLPQYAVRCACRKPEPGLILQASLQLGLDTNMSYVVGDRSTDLEAGRRAGVRRLVLVSREASAGADFGGDCHPSYVTSNLVEAADWIIRDQGGYHE